MNDVRYELRVIGVVDSPLVEVTDAPAQGDEGELEAWITMRAEYLPAMRDLVAGERVIVLTWLDRGDRNVLEVHPRGDPANELAGVFSTQSSISRRSSTIARMDERCREPVDEPALRPAQTVG